MVRLDKIDRTGHVQAIKNVDDKVIAQGQMVQLGKYSENDVYEATATLDAAATKPIGLHASVQLLNEVLLDGEGLKAGKNGRFYYLTPGDIITIPADMVDEELKVGDQIEPKSGEAKYVKADTPTYKFVWEVIEVTTLEGKPAYAINYIGL